MAKIDISTIEGYSEMTAEEKLAALEALELPEPDFSGYVNPYNDVSQARMIMATLRGEFITDIDVLAIWALNEGCYSEFRRGYSIWRDLVRINKENFEKERLS